MQQLIAQDRFLEHAVFSANHYGTSKSAVRDVIESGKTCILDVDLQGVRRIRESGLPARYIFVRPKNLETLEKRLRDRDTESEEAIQRRMLRAKEEWTYGIEPANFDHVVVNDQLDRAYMDLCDFIMPQ
ncbi:hypothetical protein BGX27_006768 [Mortierella sp. AM989]|nr:hypothetical protein BGX27_006768 [Mortierella sp. AM989]